jgi:hypothetical protein
MTYEQRQPSKHEQQLDHQTQMVDDRVQSDGRSFFLSRTDQIKSISSSASDRPRGSERLARERPPHINNSGASIHAMYQGHQNSKDGKNNFTQREAGEGSNGWREVGKIAVELGRYDAGANVGTARYVHDAHAMDHAGLYRMELGPDAVIRHSRDWRSR